MRELYILTHKVYGWVGFLVIGHIKAGLVNSLFNYVKFVTIRFCCFLWKRLQYNQQNPTFWCEYEYDSVRTLYIWHNSEEFMTGCNYKAAWPGIPGQIPLLVCPVNSFPVTCFM